MIKKILSGAIATLLFFCTMPTVNICVVNGENPILPVIPRKNMYGHAYSLKGVTLGGAGIYANPKNDRARNYVIAALNSAGINNAMTDYEKILAINNYLCQKLDYAHYATEENFSYKKDWLPFTDYCLLANSALCAGYADAFQSMCCALGIECWYVTGYVNRNNRKDSIYHAWNRVLLEQTKYYIDVCWNDASDNAYFLAKTGWEDHKIDAEHETYKISGQTFPMPAFINAST